ncbi:MAG: phosphoribosylanthranilate isomerase [Verrucomicrobiota bacterium]|nr:phosphoribosylanthranilate isomerase [Verrucomicrobiota bacterium]MDP7049597.1 phosphoribosylanthranilate isomerase [Verrucomicrobiota bacterium]
MSVRVKICGITSPEDARAAVEAGADALGFMFYEPSPRCITPEQAAAIIDELPAHVAKVGVFVDADEAMVRTTAATVGLDTLQFHGNEPPNFCARFELQTIKAFRVKDSDSLSQLPDYDTDAWLLDSHVQGMPGGTGERFNWDLAVEAKRFGRPILLAGGLTTDNAAEAVSQVAPFGLDVSSGVEAAPGCKDATKVATFVVSAKGNANADGLWAGC